MELRPSQVIALADLQNAYRAGKRRPLLCAHVAFGKSALSAYMLRRTKKRSLYLCHRENLRDMISDELRAAGIEHNLILPGKRDAHRPHSIDLGMMQTVSRRLDDLPEYQWVISDECHLAMSPTWESILKRYDKAWHLGMSATPCRMDGKGLGSAFDTIIYGPSIQESTDRGYLSPVRVFAPPLPPGIMEKAKDLSLEAAGELLNHRHITGDAIKHFRKLGEGRQGVVFCCTRKHAEAVALQFSQAGISAIAIDGSMPDAKERRLAYERGEFRLLVNIDLVTTGWDYRPVSAAIFLRHTDSLALFLQAVGRIMRVSPGKSDAILLDHVGNVFAHGLPSQEREWTLDGRAKRSAAAPLRQCPECFSVFKPTPICPMCDYEFPIKGGRKPVQQVDGELEEVNAAVLRAKKWGEVKKAMRSCKTYEDYLAVAVRFGYDKKWAFVQHSIRERYRRRAA